MFASTENLAATLLFLNIVTPNPCLDRNGGDKADTEQG